MSRLMGDATHANVATLATVPGLQLVAGYVTGTPDIQWTATDWAVFTVPGIFSVAIDQGGIGSLVPWAHVRDVEPLAWSPAAAVDRSNWTATRPTIYCDRNDLSRAGGVLWCGWQGDLWLAIPGWQLGDPLPSTPGCTVVAVQNQLDVANAYDLSIVLDLSWPQLGTENDMEPIIWWGATDGTGSTKAYLLSGSRTHHILDNAELNLWLAAGVKQVGAAGAGMSAASEAAMLADFPPGNPAVTVNTPPPPKYTITGTVTPQ